MAQLTDSINFNCVCLFVAYLLKDLDAEEIEECREAFNLFDSDADGD